MVYVPILLVLRPLLCIHIVTQRPQAYCLTPSKSTSEIFDSGIPATDGKGEDERHVGGWEKSGEIGGFGQVQAFSLRRAMERNLDGILQDIEVVAIESELAYFHLWSKVKVLQRSATNRSLPRLAPGDINEKKGLKSREDTFFIYVTIIIQLLLFQRK